MDNIKHNSKNVDYIYDTEDSNDDSVSQYQFVPREVVISPVPKRSDSWTEHESSVLLEAWGEKLLKNNRSFVKSEEWDEVAEKVSEVSKFKRTTTNCRNRLDTLKKKYKKEKAMLGDNVGLSSNWVHFSKMDMILCPYLYQANRNGLENSEVHLICANSSEETEDKEKSPGHPICANSAGEMNNGLVEGSEFANDERDNFKYIPPRKNRVRKERRIEKNESREGEKLADLEKTRIDLIRELELERKKILKRGKLEIAKIWGVDVDEDDISPDNISG